MATFTLTRPGSYDPTTGVTGAPVTTTWAGRAVQVSGGPDEFVRLRERNVTEEQAVVLGWVPTGYGAGVPDLGATIVWGGETLRLITVLKTVNPDGRGVVYARLGCAR